MNYDNYRIERSFFHSGKNGEHRTRIFMTIPTRGIMKSLLHDFLSISSGDGGNDAIYTVEELDECINDIETINYHEERWHNGIKITCFQAGHVLGAAMFMVEIDSIRVLYVIEGILMNRYTGDFSREEDRHLPAAEIPPSFLRPNIVICESTYGRAAHDDRKFRENELLSSIIHMVMIDRMCSRYYSSPWESSTSCFCLGTNTRTSFIVKRVLGFES